MTPTDFTVSVNYATFWMQHKNKELGSPQSNTVNPRQQFLEFKKKFLGLNTKLSDLDISANNSAKQDTFLSNR